MNKEFVPYEQSLELKGLEFDEPCFAMYRKQELCAFGGRWGYSVSGIMYGHPDDKFCDDEIRAPLYQQAFKWFRDKYTFYPEIGLHDREDIETWRFTISILGVYELAYNQNVRKEPYYKTYEEAELACLNKLIKLVKPNE